MSHILIDTNILSRLAQPGHSHHLIALNAVDTLKKQGHQLRIVPQNLYEFWVVATRPVSVNGLGMSATQAISEIKQIQSLFPMAPESPIIFSEWEHIVSSLPVLGKNAHDARLVAAMKVHNMTHILTFNVADFSRYPGISVLDPSKV